MPATTANSGPSSEPKPSEAVQLKPVNRENNANGHYPGLRQSALDPRGYGRFDFMYLSTYSYRSNPSYLSRGEFPRQCHQSCTVISSESPAAHSSCPCMNLMRYLAAHKVTRPKTSARVQLCHPQVVWSKQYCTTTVCAASITLRIAHRHHDAQACSSLAGIDSSMSEHIDRLTSLSPIERTWPKRT